MTRLILAAILSLAITVAAFAQAITAADKGAIQSRIDAFDTVMRSGDMAGTFDFVAPAVMDGMAAQAGITTEELRAATGIQMKAMMSTVKIEDFGMDLDAATFAVTPDGSRGYALIPTLTVMDVEGAGKMKGTSQTLSLQQDGTWYLMRVDDASQAAFLRQTYPEFADVEFPTGSIEAVN